MGKRELNLEINVKSAVYKYLLMCCGSVIQLKSLKLIEI